MIRQHIRGKNELRRYLSFCIKNAFDKIEVRTLSTNIGNLIAVY